MTNPSNTLNTIECASYKECKNAALDRLRDAVALFEKKRYTGAIYMAGYVIEIGAKAEFHRLANKEVSFDGNKFRKIIECIVRSSGKTLNKESKDWLKDNLSFPPRTSLELFNCLQKIGSFCETVNCSTIGGAPAFSVFIANRSPKQQEGGYHDIKSFLNELQAWKNLLEDGQHVELIGKYEIDWNVKMRYLSSIDKDSLAEKKNALDAIETSLSFLKDVLRIGNELVDIERDLTKVQTASDVSKLDERLLVPIEEGTY